jgi:hypothetical protein
LISILERKPKRGISPTNTPEEGSLAEETFNKKDEKLFEKEQTFVLSTPVRSYYLRAEHEEAMNDWIVSVNKMAGRTIPIKTPETLQKTVELQGEPVIG